MRLIFQIGPQLIVAVAPGTRETIAANAQGPGGTGVEAGKFTVTSNSQPGAQLMSVQLKADGSGDDSADFSQVAIYRDANSDDAYSTGDVLIDQVTAFATDNGSATFTVTGSAEQDFPITTTRTYFIVVKMNQSGTASPTEFFDFKIQDIGIGTATNSKVGVPSPDIFGVQIEGAELTVNASVGSPVSLFNDATGGGNGVQVGTFTIGSGAIAGGVLTGIELTPSGSFNDATGFTEVAIYRETNATADYQPTDTLIVSLPSFTTDNVAQMFPVPAGPQQNFGAADLRSYYVVVKLNGTGGIQTAFNCQVSSLATSLTYQAGVPSNVMSCFTIQGPTFTVAAQAGTAQNVFADEQGPGGNGLQVGTFTIACDNFPNGKLTQITLTPSGTIDDFTALSQVAIYREFDASPNGFQFGTDILIDSLTNFPSNDGPGTFDVPAIEQDFQNVTRTYYVVLKLNGSAAISQNFNSQVTDLTVTSALKAGLSGNIMNGVVIQPPTFVFTDNSPALQTVFIGSSDVVLQAFEVSYPGGPNNSFSSMTIKAVGTGDDVAHLNSVRLVQDMNSDQLFDAGDSVLATGAYSGNNDIVIFTLTGQPDFVAPATRDYLVVYDFNSSPPDGVTFACYVQAANSPVNGTAMQNLPLPDFSGAPGVQINANVLAVSLVGPSSAQTVDADELGTTGDGLELASVMIQAPPNYAWTISELTFVATGTGNHDLAFSEIVLHEDGGNGTWDGAGVDLPASSPSNFNPTTFDAGFTLINQNLAAGAIRRFILVGKLNGSATTGQTFNAKLEAMTASSSTQHQISTVPTVESSALVIDAAVLNIEGVVQPNMLRKAGTAATLMMARLKLGATNNLVSVNSITLTTAGSGDWATDFDASSGVQLWQDDGDGTFNTADTLLAQTGGVAPVMLSPAGFSVAHGTTVELWVVVELLATGGQGASAVADTYSFSISAAGDVDTGGTAQVSLSSVSPPTSSTLSIIDFFVTDFNPTVDKVTGGAAITLTGSGFITPVVVRIDGQVCPGTAVITAGGTQLSGLTVPPGAGKNLAITTTSGSLPQETLTQTFSYKVAVESGGSGSGSSGCTTNPASWPMLALLAGLALLALAARVEASPHKRRRL
jgi:hypothetical protein